MLHSTLTRTAIAALSASASAFVLAAAPSAELGAVDTVLQALQAQHLSTGRHFSKAVGPETLAFDITHFYDKNGEVSISGHAQNSSDSVFFLKGTHHHLHGFYAVTSSRVAYEFTTNPKGVVSVTEVPIAKLYPDLSSSASSSHPVSGVVLPVYSPMASHHQAPHLGPYQDQDLLKLESKPGAPYTYYLDISAVMTGNTPKNGVTKEALFRMWQSVADKYSFLQLNITTNATLYNAAKAANVRHTGRIEFKDLDCRSSGPVGSFGTTVAGTVCRNFSDGDYGYAIGMIAGHEIGTAMGLHPDSNSCTSEVQWCPIMSIWGQGTGWPQQLFTWSKGEYDNATNHEDDIGIMAAETAYADDDNVNGKPLVINGGLISAKDNWGQIERASDTDAFTFSVSPIPSVLDLRVDPLEYVRMLDVQAAIVDATGRVVAQSNLFANRSAEFKNLTLVPGNYRLVIQGGAEGTPQRGFSNYSSLGFYGIEGRLLPACGDCGHGGQPVANFTSKVNGLTVMFTDTSVDHGGQIGSHAWRFGDGATSTAANPTHTYFQAGTYTVSETVTDSVSKMSSTKTQAVVVQAGGGATVANFSFKAVDKPAHTVAFTDKSTTSGGVTITARLWNFGDGKKAQTAKPRHTYAKAGTFTVTETVTDSTGKTASQSQTVVVK